MSRAQSRAKRALDKARLLQNAPKQERPDRRHTVFGAFGGSQKGVKVS